MKTITNGRGDRKHVDDYEARYWIREFKWSEVPPEPVEIPNVVECDSGLVYLPPVTPAKRRADWYWWGLAVLCVGFGVFVALAYMAVVEALF